MKKVLKLTSEQITLADTALGGHQQIIKRQVNNVITKMLREEREDLRKNLEKMDEKEDEEHSPLISVMPKLGGENHHRSLLNSPPRTRQKGTTLKAMMKQ